MRKSLNYLRNLIITRSITIQLSKNEIYIKDIVETQNVSSSLNQTDCSIPQEFTTASRFFSCYYKLFIGNIEANILKALMIFFTISLNTIIIIVLSRKRVSNNNNNNKKNVFDKIMISHCVVDGLTGLLDAPFFCTIDIFGFWPLNHTFGLIWCAFDSGICTVSNLHMLYITYARMRSIQAPFTFENEHLIRKPLVMLASFYLIGYTIWIPIVFGFGSSEFSASIDWQPYYLPVIVEFVAYFIPLAGTILIGFYMIFLLNKRKQQTRVLSTIKVVMNNNTIITKHLKSKSHKSVAEKILKEEQSVQNVVVAADSRVLDNSFRYRLIVLKEFLRKMFQIKAQGKFQIIVISYWAQWLPTYVINLFNPLCNNCVPFDIYNDIYWLTYTVSMTDPLIIWLFNSRMKRRN